MGWDHPPFHPLPWPILLSLTYKQEKTEKTRCGLPGPSTAGGFRLRCTLQLCEELSYMVMNSFPKAWGSTVLETSQLILMPL